MYDLLNSLIWIAFIVSAMITDGRWFGEILSTVEMVKSCECWILRM